MDGACVEGEAGSLREDRQDIAEAEVRGAAGILRGPLQRADFCRGVGGVAEGQVIRWCGLQLH